MSREQVPSDETHFLFDFSTAISRQQSTVPVPFVLALVFAVAVNDFALATTRFALEIPWPVGHPKNFLTTDPTKNSARTSSPQNGELVEYFRSVPADISENRRSECPMRATGTFSCSQLVPRGGEILIGTDI